MDNNDNNHSKELSLEDIIVLANKIGLEYVERRRDAERFEILRTSIRARIMNEIEKNSSEKIPETKLKRLAEAAPEYLLHLEEIANKRADAEKIKVRYDSYRNLFEAKRTMISYKKTELKTL